MTSLACDGIILAFDDAWSVEKWDDERWYREGIQRLNGELDGKPEGTKAADVIGIRVESGRDIPYIFEVKDFRGAAIENKRRQLGELPLEVGLKARDTIAGLAGLVATRSQHAISSRWIAAIQAQREELRVVALLAEDVAQRGETRGKRDIHDNVRTKQFKKRLAWLTPKVIVRDPLRDEARRLSKIGVIATSASGSGPGRPR